MMILQLLAFAALCISKVFSQPYPVAMPCQQRGVPVAASQPVFIRASPIPVPASPCPASPLPCPSLAIANIAPKQQTVLPIEYALANQAILPQALPIEYALANQAILPQALPVSLAPTASAPCYLPLQNPCATEFIVPSCPNCLTDICSPDPVFHIFGCLDPILTCCGPITELEIPELPSCPLISPYLPAASPASILPPILSSDCSCHFLKKIAIPPPFI